MHVVPRVLVTPERFGIIARKQVRVKHPTEHSLMEVSTDRVARALRRDGALGTEHGVAVPG